MMTRSAAILAIVSLAFHPNSAISQALPHDHVKTIDGARVLSPAARSQPCDADSCADRRLLSVTLPHGSRYVGTHYFTNANYPNDLADVRDTGPVEVAWGRFTPEVHVPNEEGQVVVTVFYYNRSTRNRIAAISVDYEE
jgi:hypothetical protein